MSRHHQAKLSVGHEPIGGEPMIIVEHNPGDDDEVLDCYPITPEKAQHMAIELLNAAAWTRGKRAVEELTKKGGTS